MMLGTTPAPTTNPNPAAANVPHGPATVPPLNVANLQQTANKSAVHKTTATPTPTRTPPPVDLGLSLTSALPTGTLTSSLATTSTSATLPAQVPPSPQVPQIPTSQLHQAPQLQQPLSKGTSSSFLGHFHFGVRRFLVLFKNGCGGFRSLLSFPGSLISIEGELCGTVEVNPLPPSDAVQKQKNFSWDLFSSVFSQFIKYHTSGNLKFNYLGIFQS